MEKSLAQSTISKNIPVSSSPESEDDCDNKCKKPRKYNIRAFQENWKIDYLLSPIPDGSKPQCLICYEILSENRKNSVKRHYLSKHETSIEKNFQSTAMNEKKNKHPRTKIKTTANFIKEFDDRKSMYSILNLTSSHLL